MTEDPNPQNLQALEQAVADYRREREQLEAARKVTRGNFFEKNWQAIISIVVAVTGAAVSMTQVYSARLQNRQDTSLRTAEIVEKFIPHLIDPQTRDGALVVMTGFVDRSEVERLAITLQAKPALQQFAIEGTKEQKALAGVAVDKINTELQSLVQGMFADDRQTRIDATTKLIRSWNSDPGLVRMAIGFAEQHPENSNGAINTIVLLQNMKKDLLMIDRASIEAFISAASRIGPQTKAQGDKLLSELNS